MNACACNRQPPPSPMPQTAISAPSSAPAQFGRPGRARARRDRCRGPSSPSCSRARQPWTRRVPRARRPTPRDPPRPNLSASSLSSATSAARSPPRNSASSSPGPAPRDRHRRLVAAAPADYLSRTRASSSPPPPSCRPSVDQGEGLELGTDRRRGRTRRLRPGRGGRGPRARRRTRRHRQGRDRGWPGGRLPGGNGIESGSCRSPVARAAAPGRFGKARVPIAKNIETLCRRMGLSAWHHVEAASSWSSPTWATPAAASSWSSPTYLGDGRRRRARRPRRRRPGRRGDRLAREPRRGRRRRPRHAISDLVARL